MSVVSRIAITWRGAIRPLIHHPRASLLSVISVGLGVAVFLSITIANRSAVESFHKAFAMVTGKADLEIRGRLPETLLPAVQGCEGVVTATPLIEGMVTLPDFPGETLHLVGIDPFSASGLLSMEPSMSEEGQGDLAGWLSAGDALAVTPDFLKKHGVKLGDRVRLQGPGAPRWLTIRYLVHSDDAVAGNGGRVAAIDLAAAQEWLGPEAMLTAILVKIHSAKEEAQVIKRLKAILPSDVTIAPPSRRTHQVDVMLSAFTLNLTALSLVSLMVGMFFVGNTAAAAVVRRRVSHGILRAVGTSRPMILGMVLAEAALCGLIGSLLGVLASPLLAGVLAAPVAQTVSSLYLPVDAHGGWPTLVEALAGIAAGVGAALVAAWIPARQAARVDPCRVLHPGAAPEIFPMPAWPLAALGMVMLLLALILSLGSLHGGPALLGFGAAFCVLAGFSLEVPLVTMVAAVLLRKLVNAQHFSGGAIIRIALEQSMKSLHRTAPTIAALAAAVAMTVGISVMIHSFRGSVLAWAERTLQADLFIAPASNELLGLEHTLPEQAATWWSNRTGVKDVATFREVEAESVDGKQVTLGVVSGPARGDIDFLHGDTKSKTEALARGEGVALSESLGQRLHLVKGDSLHLVSPHGPISLPVLDLYRDYTRDRGIAMIGDPYFQRVWGIKGVHSLAITFREGASMAFMESESEAFRKAFGGKDAIICYSNRALKARILEIFNQTFAVTAVLRTISIAVAIGGVMLTLGILVLERSRDIGVLRSMGASTGQVVGVMLSEATLIGLISSFVGLVSGAVLALVLTWVINKAFFGWSIDLAYPWAELAFLPLWMIAASLAAGLFPALKASKISPAAALRME